ncbi:hypothetical protein DV736_g6517, partial [Chaetothyriales sp. CBS 134916]
MPNSGSGSDSGSILYLFVYIKKKPKLLFLKLPVQGFWYQPAPQIRRNMTNDIHIETTMFQQGDDPAQPPRPVRAIIRDVSHFLLGRVEGSHDITIHVLFLHLDADQDGFISLTDHDYTRWFDKIFHPIIYCHYTAHYTQHLPASFRQAFFDSKAHQVKGRQIDTASYQSQLALGYHLQPQHLGQVWNNVIETSRTRADLADFREPQLFVSAKD